VQAKKPTLSSAVKQFWDDVTGEEVFMEAKGKKESGRRLDGVTWDELPQAA
jgi:protein gp37